MRSQRGDDERQGKMKVEAMMTRAMTMKDEGMRKEGWARTRVLFE